MAGMRLRKYNVQTTIDFEVFEVDGVDLRVDWTPAQSDCEIMKDGGASTQCTNTATDEGSTYSIVLTAAEMQAARLVLKIVDSATKQFLDTVIHIETYGHASAQHAFDLDTAAVVPDASGTAAGLHGTTDGKIDALNNFDASATPVEILATGGTAGKNAAELVDDIVDEDISKSEHNVTNSLAKKVRGIEHVTVLHEGQAQGAGGGNDTIELAEAASDVNNWYKDDWIMLVEGTGENQMHHIESYVGSTRIVTLGENWLVNPDSSTDYVIIAQSSVHVHRFEQAAKDEINAEADTALSDINLDHLMKVVVADRDVMAEVVDGTVLANLMTKTDGDTSDFDPDTDSLEAIRDRGDAAWAGAPESVSGTIAVATADTIFDLTATLGTLSTADDTYNNMIICILDNSGSIYETARITDYDGTGLTRITIDHELTFPVQDGVDTFVIYRAAFAPVGAASITEGDKNDIVDKICDEDVRDAHKTPGTVGHYVRHSGSRY